MLHILHILGTYMFKYNHIHIYFTIFCLIIYLSIVNVTFAILMKKKSNTYFFINTEIYIIIKKKKMQITTEKPN